MTLYILFFPVCESHLPILSTEKFELYRLFITVTACSKYTRSSEKCRHLDFIYENINMDLWGIGTRGLVFLWKLTSLRKLSLISMECFNSDIWDPIIHCLKDQIVTLSSSFLVFMTALSQNWTFKVYVDHGAHRECGRAS